MSDSKHETSDGSSGGWRPVYGEPAGVGVADADMAADRWDDDGGRFAFRFPLAYWIKPAWSVLSLKDLNDLVRRSGEQVPPAEEIRDERAEDDHAIPRGDATPAARGRSDGAAATADAPAYVGPVPVVRRDGGPQFDRADVPTAEEEAVFGRKFETAAEPARNA